MPLGNPQAYMQQGAPQGGGVPGGAMPQAPALPPEVLELLQQLLTTMPDQPTGNAGINTPATPVPGIAQVQNPQQELIQMLTGILQQGNPVSNAQSGMQGFRGASGGVLGGRPRGS